jgi:hypothetical protein
MTDHTLPEDPADAARALAEIDRRQRQVIDNAALPDWYWWAVGGLMVVLAAGVDVRTGTSIGIAVPVFVVGMLAATCWVTVGAFRRALPRNDLLGGRAALGIVSFVLLTVGITLAVAFGLRAGGVPYPATLGCLLGAVLLGTGGPLLRRYLTRVMLSNRTGARR